MLSTEKHSLNFKHEDNGYKNKFSISNQLLQFAFSLVLKIHHTIGSELNATKKNQFKIVDICASSNEIIAAVNET